MAANRTSYGSTGRRRTASTIVALVVAAGSLALAGPTSSAFGASSNVTKACRSLERIEDDFSDITENLSPGSLDTSGFSDVGAAFTKAARTAPKNIKGALKQLGKLYSAIGDADNAIDAGRELAKQSQNYTNALTKFGTFYATKCLGARDSSSRAPGGSGSGTGGTVVLDGESIELTSSLCFLEEQVAAGQDIELTAQARGVNAAGDDVTIDFTRYAEGGTFAGDDITVVVGAVGDPDASNLSGRLDHGEVERSGDTLSLDDAELQDLDRGEMVTMSFEVEC